MLCMIRLLVITLLFSIFILSSLWAVPPVINYAGQVRVAGQPFSGTGYLKFAFVNASGTTTYWSHDGTSVGGSEPTGELSVQVRGGLYSILLGNTALSGMGAIDLSLFQQYDDVHIRVWFNDGERGFQHLHPDRPFASVPYALSAGTAGSAGIAPGSVTLNMLGSDVQTSLSSTIDRSRLSADVLADLNKTIVITREMLPEDVRSDLNRTVTLSDLSPEVVADLNDSVADGSITTNQLNEQILKYLRPEVVRSPELPQNREQVYTGQSVTLSADAEGKYLTYQWLRNGQEIFGATNKQFTISDANATLHDGNYSVRISNDFGHVSTTSVQLDVNDTQLIHEVDLNASVALEMIWVEPGTFTMGSPTTEAYRFLGETQHEVTLTQGFYLGKYEVTQAQYEAVMNGNDDGLNATPSNWPNNPDRPVEQVSHDDIQKFLTRLNTQQAGNIPEGWAYVLPTEAQWEYACRAGTTTAYSWGDSITTDNANYASSGYSQTQDVGQYSANPWGFFDMHGNVWEWTADWHAAYSSGAQTDPEGAATGSRRVKRGGSWYHSGTNLRSAYRYNPTPSTRNYFIGFRVGFQQVPADVASPEMSILGDANITQLQGVAWVDPGVEAHDVHDGNLSGDVIVSGTVDVNTVGTYTLTYTVSDAAGNQASLTRTVNIVAGQASTHTADLNASVALEMIWVDPGTFTMGSPTTETGRTSSETQHEVTLTQGFYLGKYEVTQAQYESVMTGNMDSLSVTPSQWPNNPDRPVDKVSYDDIQKFLTRLNTQQAGNIPEGWAYVLPTEAQWEYACRAGTTTAYSWGDSISASDANWNHGNDPNRTENVGQYSANPWGFFDMHGNVREWTANWYAAYSSGAQTDPEGPATGSSRVLRGGSWRHTGPYLRSANRTTNIPSYRNSGIGFRVGFQQVPADVASPEMQILGDANITQLQGVAWVDPGVEAHDVRDGNLSGDVTVSGTVDVNTIGTYTLTYTVSDAAGNQASLTRTVNVGTPATYASDLNSSVALEMIWVDPGTFTMGSPTTEAGRSSNETQHNVTLTQGFYLGKYEVTQAQYEAVMTGNTDSLSATPSYWPNNPDRPVEQVSHDDIQKFLTRLNTQQAGNIPEGWAYVLPTEAQWEYACRAGTTTAYSWGDAITSTDANYNNSIGQTADVGQYGANPWGFFDMHGNVWEWTADWYAAYSSGAQTDPEGPATDSSSRVYRGGSWGGTGMYLRSAYRSSNGSSVRSSYIGFRVGFQQQ
jgi:formylglycine-generating enzyme required for sulfatase activity